MKIKFIKKIKINSSLHSEPREFKRPRKINSSFLSFSNINKTKYIFIRIKKCEIGNGPIIEYLNNIWGLNKKKN